MAWQTQQAAPLHSRKFQRRILSANIPNQYPSIEEASRDFGKKCHGKILMSQYCAT